ncbi:hypothetical protein [Actinomadura sp. NBRC 104412]|uniref:hypothetical protein n=1 Tax=Actinomadura sp. NBRC 104412 TaxID=3032203 RepID=UPI00255543B2|nr:hypothetical protein [Actinomadura sp. NBRC 104412]
MPGPSLASRAFRVAASSAVLVLATAACGGTDEVTMPPLTPEPGLETPASVGAATQASAAPKDTFPARLTLFKFLRGIAINDARVCAHLAPEYERTVFGAEGGCRRGLAQARSRLRPQDLTALRGVTVPTARPGSQPGDLVVDFATLRWRTAPARPGGLLASTYTLRQDGGRWLIVG